VREAREHLVRLAPPSPPDGDVLPDVRAKAPGRGAWIGVTAPSSRRRRPRASCAVRCACVQDAAISASPTICPRIADAAAAQRARPARAGIQSRRAVTIGGEKLDKAARSGKLHLLLHASDAARTARASSPRHGASARDMEGSGRKGLTLPIPRTILSLALGRENVVHAGLTDARAAKRVSEALDRWLHFIGPEPYPVPCETGSQGASALPRERRRSRHDELD
jgi:hypothetical protein